MDLTFEALEPEYKQDLAAMKFLRMTEATTAAKQLLAHRDRFLAVQKDCGVPALWTMPVFERENPRFDAYFGNGDRIIGTDKKTTDWPRNRGPFATWEEGVTDALDLDHVVAAFNRNPHTWEFAVYEWEKWNGFGPREHSRPSGYPWSGTSIYRGGKFVHDGPGGWSRGTWDHQLGTVILARAIAELDSEIGQGFVTA